MPASKFHKITLDFNPNIFPELRNATDFESVAKGRMGNHLVNVDGQAIPIVRTTTRYTIPANTFASIHNTITASINHTIQKDSSLTGIPAQHFNNALIEVYDSTYTKMNYHSDQSLDLADDSYIALFSCYENPDNLSPQHTRKLKIKDKVSNEETEVILTHNSVVLFSLPTNTRYHHKIVLDPILNTKPLAIDNKWLGITFRTSKTYIQIVNNIPCFPNHEPLTMATPEQEKEFFTLRGQENRSLDFAYPTITYTLSAADTMPPKAG